MTSPDVIILHYRQSSRISDQKQRELAEKILQANRQALEAEKVSGSPPEKLLAGIPTENLGTSEQLEVKGRGRGRGRKSKQEEVDVDDIDVEVEREEEKVNFKYFVMNFTDTVLFNCLL